MTAWGLQPIDTYRLVESARQTTCLICEGPNRLAAETCQYCGAPLSLGMQPGDGKNERRLVALLGAPGAGKSVYLGVLADLLSRQAGPVQLLARGAFSVAMQQQIMAALAKNQFPPPTARCGGDWRWLHCEVSTRRRSRTTDLLLPDFDGQTFLDSLQHCGNIPVLRRFLTNCAAGMVMVDTERIERGDRDHELETMQILSYLSELGPAKKPHWQRRPLALVFAKADCSETCFAGPEAYAAQSTPMLWHHCQKRFRQHAFFAVAVAGATAELELEDQMLRIPLRIEPRGVAEPLEWLLGQLRA